MSVVTTAPRRRRPALRMPPPHVLPVVAVTVLGAAYLAGIAIGTWTADDVRGLWREARRFEPQMSDDERRTLLSGWRRALERAAGWEQA